MVTRKEQACKDAAYHALNHDYNKAVRVMAIAVAEEIKESPTIARCINAVKSFRTLSERLIGMEEYEAAKYSTLISNKFDEAKQEISLRQRKPHEYVQEQLIK